MFPNQKHIAMQTILGAGGAIGDELAKSLFPYTTKLRLVSRYPKKINETDQLVSADLTVRNNIYKAIEGSDVVYVVIGFPYKATVWEKIWPSFIHNVINACIFYRCKLVFFDNMYMYDPAYLGHMTEETPIRPVSRKGEVRARVAKKITDLFESERVDSIIARAPDFLGSHNSIIGNLIWDNLEKGKKAMCLLSSSTKRNAITPFDAAKATALLGNTAEAYNQVWHLPSTQPALSGEEWVQLFAKEIGCEPKYTVLSETMINLLGTFVPIMREMKEMSYQYKNDYYFDSSKFEKHFNYTPLTAQQAVQSLVHFRKVNLALSK